MFSYESMMHLDIAYVWYHDWYVKITVTHCDFTEATECNFWKITVNYRDSGISTVIANIHIVGQNDF
jgi:hypothetical protein